jgi:hypothetical protein
MCFSFEARYRRDCSSCDRSTSASLNRAQNFPIQSDSALPLSSSIFPPLYSLLYPSTSDPPPSSINFPLHFQAQHTNAHPPTSPHHTPADQARLQTQHQSYPYRTNPACRAPTYTHDSAIAVPAKHDTASESETSGEHFLQRGEELSRATK